MSCKKLCVAVLYGGHSAEREISIVTGQQIIANLDRQKYIIKPLEIPRKGNKWVARLIALKPDVVIPALHGPFGEDGTIQGLLEGLGMPYVFSGVSASALAMNKYLLQKLVKANGVRVPKNFLAKAGTPLNIIARAVGFPCVVKPNCLGSSVGISVNIKNKQDLSVALKLAFYYGPEALVEQHISGREITAPIFGNERPRALPLIEIKPKIGGFYNYQSKYDKGGSEHIVPAPLNRGLAQQIQNIALSIHLLIGARGATRSDFILSGKTPYFLEINTIPGMTQTSLVPESARAAGISFSQLLDKIINFAIFRH